MHHCLLSMARMAVPLQVRVSLAVIPIVVCLTLFSCNALTKHKLLHNSTKS